MHRAALAAAEAILLAEDLRHHRLLVAALGDAVAVAAMRAGDGVAVVEMHADADARCLLAGVELHEARNVAGRELVMHGILELADHAHPLVGLHKIIPAELHLFPPIVCVFATATSGRPGGAAAPAESWISA